MRFGMLDLSRRFDLLIATKAKTGMDYGATSTANEALGGLDLRGKRLLVTGVASGVGVETARVLTAHGAAVVGTARDLAKGARALRSVRSVRSEGDIELAELDPSSLSSVRACADALVKTGKPLTQSSPTLA